MIAEIGHFALILALGVALAQTILPIWGAQRGDYTLMRVGVPAAQVQLCLLLLAFFALMTAYVTSDFSLLNVVQNSHSAKPLLYKISGVWGEPRRLHAPLGADSGIVRGRRGCVWAQPAA